MGLLCFQFLQIYSPEFQTNIHSKQPVSFSKLLFFFHLNQIIHFSFDISTHRILNGGPNPAVSLFMFSSALSSRAFPATYFLVHASLAQHLLRISTDRGWQNNLFYPAISVPRRIVQLISSILFNSVAGAFQFLSRKFFSSGLSLRSNGNILG